MNLGIVVGDGNCTSRFSVDVPSSDVPVRPIQGVLEEKVLVGLEGENVGPELHPDFPQVLNRRRQVSRAGGSQAILVADGERAGTDAPVAVAPVGHWLRVDPGIGSSVDEVAPAIGRLEVIEGDHIELSEVGRGRGPVELAVVLAASSPGTLALVLLLGAQPRAGILAPLRSLVVLLERAALAVSTSKPPA